MVLETVEMADRATGLRHCAAVGALRCSGEAGKGSGGSTATSRKPNKSTALPRLPLILVVHPTKPSSAGALVIVLVPTTALTVGQTTTGMTLPIAMMHRRSLQPVLTVLRHRQRLAAMEARLKVTHLAAAAAAAATATIRVP